MAAPRPRGGQVLPRNRDLSINCAKCHRVRTEDVPWARPGARHTNASSAVVAWLAQRTDKTTLTG